MPPRAPRRALAVFALAATVATVNGSCGGDFDPPSALSSLRVLAVKVNPPYGQPGAEVNVEMLHYDGSPRSRRPDGSLRPIQILWLGGCHNPPSDQYTGCFESLGRALAGLTPADFLGGQASEVVGLGPTFKFTVPTNIADRPPPGDNAPAYGLSYLFFAACGGQLEQDASVSGNLPLRCVDPASGEVLGPDDFVIGYTPIYSYATITNANPVTTGLLFQGALDAVPPLSCANVLDCGEGQGCSPDGRCLPRVPPCTEEKLDDCPEYELRVEVTQPAEEDTASKIEGGDVFFESIWASYFSTDGRFTREAALVNDAQQGWVDEQETKWRAPNAPAGLVRFWAVVRDSRGGTDWQIRDILVE
jgi:hypothetical protein